jgi:trans-aconitate methyltransferase
MNTPVSSFYDSIQFPGFYTYGLLSEYDTPIQNPYLRIIESQFKPGQRILDAGCGTGLTTNLFAMRNTDSQFVGIDFADSIYFASDFARTNNLSNVQFIKSDLAKVSIDGQFDVVICQGVLHHIPYYEQVIDRLINWVALGGTLVLGLYHPAGKVVKRYINIDYGNQTLSDDQEINPFEMSFTSKQVKELVPNFKLVSAYPRYINNITIPAFFNYRNGGLVTYIFRKPV